MEPYQIDGDDASNDQASVYQMTFHLVATGLGYDYVPSNYRELFKGDKPKQDLDQAGWPLQHDDIFLRARVVAEDRWERRSNPIVSLCHGPRRVPPVASDGSRCHTVDRSPRWSRCVMSPPASSPQITRIGATDIGCKRGQYYCIRQRTR